MRRLLRKIIFGGEYIAPPGQVVITATGSGTWTVPDGVNSVCVVCVGPGATRGSADYTGGGGGGGLGWKNDIPVTSGTSISYNVGARGSGQSTWFLSTNTVRGGAGSPGAQDDRIFSGDTVAGGSGGTYTGDGGGNGGDGGTTRKNDSGSENSDPDVTAGGGGGAGGYSGNGGTGGRNTSGTEISATAGSGGGGGGGDFGGGQEPSFGDEGGGVGLLGQGASGAAGSPGQPGSNLGGGVYGAGDGGHGDPSYSFDPLPPAAQNGAIRIIWGEGRSYPSNAADV